MGGTRLNQTSFVLCNECCSNRHVMHVYQSLTRFNFGGVGGLFLIIHALYGSQSLGKFCLLFKQWPLSELVQCISARTLSPQCIPFQEQLFNKALYLHTDVLHYILLSAMGFTWSTVSICSRIPRTRAFLPQNKRFSVVRVANIATVYLRLTAEVCSTCWGLRHLLRSVVLCYFLFVYLFS